jgi:hypothetical protein
MKLLYLVIFSIGWSNAYTQAGTKIIFEETQADSIGKKIKNILLIGVGTSATRIFLDDLNDHIIKELNNDGVLTKYYFLGKSIAEERSGFDTIDKAGFDVVLFFLPKGESLFDVQGKTYRNKSKTAIGPITTKIAKSQVYYEQDFNFLLCMPTGNLKEIWTASVRVSCDLTKSKNAKKVGTKLLSSLKSNKYID